MLVMHQGIVSEIDDSRIRLAEVEDVAPAMAGKLKQVYLDDMLYMQAIEVFVEHKQYNLMLSSYESLDFMSLFGNSANVVFCDLGTCDESIDWSQKDISSKVTFKDYSAKAKEGVSYFNDIIIADDKLCVFKNNYVATEVRL